MSWYLCNRGSPLLQSFAHFLRPFITSSDAASFLDVTVSPGSSWKSSVSPWTGVLPYDHSSLVCTWNWMGLSMPCWSQGFYTSISLKNTASKVIYEINRWMTWILRKYLLSNSHPVVMVPSAGDPPMLLSSGQWVIESRARGQTHVNMIVLQSLR